MAPQNKYKKFLQRLAFHRAELGKAVSNFLFTFSETPKVLSDFQNIGLLPLKTKKLWGLKHGTTDYIQSQEIIRRLVIRARNNVGSTIWLHYPRLRFTPSVRGVSYTRVTTPSVVFSALNINMGTAVPRPTNGENRSTLSAIFSAAQLVRAAIFGGHVVLKGPYNISFAM